jgi:hypothetical protein
MSAWQKELRCRGLSWRAVERRPGRYNQHHAGVAQLVERRLPKPEVASSRLVARSIFLA